MIIAEIWQRDGYFYCTNPRSKIKAMKATTTAVPLERLLEQLPENYSIADRELIQRAYRVAGCRAEHAVAG